MNGIALGKVYGETLKKIAKFIALISCLFVTGFAIGYFNPGQFLSLNAMVKISNWVYTVNNVPADSTGNINVTRVNNYSVASDVPANADFLQYNQNVSELALIDYRISMVQATAENVTNGKKFLAADGTVTTGTQGSDVGQE